MLIVGPKEAENNTVSVRRKFKVYLGKLDLDILIENIKIEISSRNL